MLCNTSIQTPPSAVWATKGHKVNPVASRDKAQSNYFCKCVKRAHMAGEGAFELGPWSQVAPELQKCSGCLHRVCSLLQISTKQERQCRVNVLLIHSELIFNEVTEHPGIRIPENVLSCESWPGLLCVSVSKHTMLKQGICNPCKAECFTKDMERDGSHLAGG